MAERQFYVYKFNSNVLDAKKYRINLTFRQARENLQVVALADSQMLRSIRDISGRNIDYSKIEMMYNKRDELMSSKETLGVARDISKQIIQALFVPEYVSVIIDKKSHYKKIIKNGIYINGDKYMRFSCSASQARVNTIIMIREDVSNELDRRLNNGRKDIPLNPSKFNAYFGLNSSATKVVRKPRAVVVKDLVKKRKTYVNWVDIVDEEPLKDDIVTEKWVDFEYNYFDGMGLISPHLAQLWSEDLGLDYMPAEFCIRSSFIKGMVCVFDFWDFCDKENGGNYEIEDLYGNKVDIRRFDIILTESQFKLWNCYDSYEQYDSFCDKNGLLWGVSQFTPKHDKRTLTLNYQSIQTLDLSDKDIDELVKYSIETFSKISGKDVIQTLLFMLGDNISEKYIENYLDHSDNYVIKSLLLDKSLIQDKHIQQKIYENISNRIKSACLGEVYVEGNYQVLVSDPYALMEHVCGQEVKGLLLEKQHYSRYWIDRKVSVVDSMRSPLTYYSEHNLLNITNDEKIEYWYKYLYTGIVVNVHGDDVIRWSD